MSHRFRSPIATPAAVFKMRGFSVADMMMAILVMGVISLMAIPFIINVKEADSTFTQTRDNAAESIAKGFDAVRGTSGLIPKSQGPSQILLASLNKTDMVVHESNEIPDACDEQVALPAKEMTIQGGKLKVYVADQWTLNSTEGDYTDVCIESVQNQAVSLKHIPREGDQVGVVNNAAGTEFTHGNTTTTVTTNGGNVGTGGNGGGFATRITPRFVSVYTQRNLTSDLSGTTFTATNQATGESVSGSGTVTVEGMGSFMLTINQFPTFTDRAYAAAPAPMVVDVTIGDNAPTILIEDRYQLGTALKSPFANMADKVTNHPNLPAGETKGVPIDVTVAINKVHINNKKKVIVDSTLDSKTVDNIISTSTNNWLIPAGLYQLSISGQDIKTYRSQPIDLTSQPRTMSANLGNKMDINILGIGANILGPMFNYAGQLTHMHLFNAQAHDPVHLNIMNSYLGLNGGLFSLLHRTHTLLNTTVGHGHYYTSVGVRNKESGGIQHNAHNFVSTLTPVPGTNKSLFMGPAPLYRIYRANRLLTPIKIKLTPGHAQLNSDDSFTLDADGFEQNTEAPIQTPGGLNAQEGWLVLDRDRNGTWENNTLDNDDLFGDHLGRVKNGYVDLQKTFPHELKTDAKGNQYIDLREYSWWGELQLYISRSFMNDSIPYAAYDLQVLTRDRQLVPARDVLDKVYVSYWNVEEHDAKHLNSIFQRAWVHYPGGEFHHSADQYFAVPSGVLEEVTGPEADALRAKMLKTKS